MEHDFFDNRSADTNMEVSSGTLNSRLKQVDASRFGEQVLSSRQEAPRQVVERRYSQEENEGASGYARTERDYQAYGSRSAPHYERSR